MHKSVARSFAVACAIAAAQTTFAQTTARVSVDSSGAQGNANSGASAISSDGNCVAFLSAATNLVASDTNATTDVFVHDLSASATSIVSVDSSGAQGNGGCYVAEISADGRYVAFSSDASNLVGGDSNGCTDVFVRDRQLGLTTRVSISSSGVQGNGQSYYTAISADGRFVAFDSLATNFVAGDTNGTTDVFVHDRQSGTTVLVSVAIGGLPGNSVSYLPAISGNGQCVAFLSGATDLVVGDLNAYHDVFVRDLQTNTTSLVSVSTSGLQTDSQSYAPSVSFDGRYVAFPSFATNLVPGDGNGAVDVFVRDRGALSTKRASVSSTGQEGDFSSGFPQASISDDGRYVAFVSSATNLVINDTNARNDVFVRDLLTETTTRVSVGPSNAQSNASGQEIVWISGDGRKVGFASDATNLVAGDTNGATDSFVRDRGAASGFVSYCFGDGTGTPCPCANTGAAGRGCANSFAPGAVVDATGTASVAADDLVITASSLPITAPALLFQGTAKLVGGLGLAFGDGLRCVGGTVRRLGVRSATNGVASFGPGLGSVGGWSVGQLKHFQVWYRNTAGLCGSGFNLTQGLSIGFM